MEMVNKASLLTMFAVCFRDIRSVKVTTEECAGDRTLPVLNGTDTVAYFSLEPGEPAVVGNGRYKTVFNGYTFLFATRENMLIFEVRPLRPKHA